MKKIIALIALMLFTAAGTALADGTALATGATLTSGNGEQIYGGADATAAALATAPVLGRLSKGVQLGVNYTNAAYALTTKHLTGSKRYGTAYDSTAIFSLESASGTAVVAPTSNSATAFNATGWTAM